MKVQELIDQIQDIKTEATFSRGDEKDDLEKSLARIFRICDNILIDWKMENAKCLSRTNSNEKL